MSAFPGSTAWIAARARRPRRCAADRLPDRPGEHSDLRQAMKAGAVDFLTKPVSGDALIAAVGDAVAKAAARRRRAPSGWRRTKTFASSRQRLARLTRRERQVLAAVAAGPAQQADRRRSRHRRADGEIPSRPADGAHAGAHRGGTDAHRRPARHPSGAGGKSSRVDQTPSPKYSSAIARRCCNFGGMERTRAAVAGARIATVDDEAPVRVALARLLRLADYEVAGFDRARAFLGSLATARPDCAIVDIHMPGTERLRGAGTAARRNIDLPVVLITASDDAALDAAARAAGAVAPAAQAVLGRPAAGRRSRGAGRTRAGRRLNQSLATGAPRAASGSSRDPRSARQLVVSRGGLKSVARRPRCTSPTIHCCLRTRRR